MLCKCRHSLSYNCDTAQPLKQEAKVSSITTEMSTDMKPGIKQGNNVRYLRQHS